MKEEQQTIVKQHYVARSYLRPWTNDNDQVWAFGRESGKVFQPRSTAIAYEKHFYDVPETLIPSDSNTFQIVERNLAKLEGMGLKSIERALSMARTQIGKKTTCSYNDAGFLSSLDIRNLISYMALQYLRSKSMRDFIREVITKNSQRILEETTPIHFPHVDVSKIELKISEDHIKREHIRLTFDAFEEIVTILERKIFVLSVNSTSTTLVTSDNPVVRIGIPLHPNIPYDGLDSPGIWITMPFGPHFAVCLYDSKIYCGQRKWHRRFKQLNIEQVRELNEKQLLQCSRFTFSNRNSFKWAHEAMKEFPRLAELRQDRYSSDNKEMDQLLEFVRELAKEYKQEDVQSED